MGSAASSPSASPLVDVCVSGQGEETFREIALRLARGQNIDDVAGIAFKRDGAVVMLPHPNGKRSPHVFRLVALDGAARRVEFANPENDFPTNFVYAIGDDGWLRVTLTGGGHTEEYRLERVVAE